MASQLIEGFDGIGAILRYKVEYYEEIDENNNQIIKSYINSDASIALENMTKKTLVKKLVKDATDFSINPAIIEDKFRNNRTLCHKNIMLLYYI